MSFRIKYILILLVFLILQIIWFNHIRLFNHFTPIVFIYPFLILPLSKSESLNLFAAFVTGLIIDLVSNTGGIFAATAVFITYMRKIYFMASKNPVQKIQEINIGKINSLQKIIYFGVFISLAHIMIFFLDAFNAGLVISKLQSILINTIISLIFIIFFDLIFFNPAKK